SFEERGHERLERFRIVAVGHPKSFQGAGDHGKVHRALAFRSLGVDINKTRKEKLRKNSTSVKKLKRIPSKQSVKSGPVGGGDVAVDLSGDGVNGGQHVAVEQTIILNLLLIEPTAVAQGQHMTS